MDDSSLDLDPDGLLQVARGVGDLAHRLLSVGVPTDEEALLSWADELPRIGTELHQVEELLREVARSVTATDDELAARLARHGDA
ncbi:hypothetical protein [Micromonospora sp. WMMD812]|uniref:hypothetical protein n=1 Tax=Micromonospora sp. WMMD812 TaxID=3015152 RepID=UPI00248C34F8|nr:hypothetical protein [Micromonospora sp. WMMD812]WBB68832.1 hypothetical protein O7603_05555 [Micromonospora sp. WMMD812]